MEALRFAHFPVTAFQQNCSIVWEPASLRAAVVDPGGEPEKILELISRLGLEVEAILLTHGHLDHAGAATPLKDVLDAAREGRDLAPVPILGPELRDRFLLESIEQQQTQFGLTGLRNVTPDRWLAEGDVVELGALRLDVLHVPGHSPGHVVFVEKIQRLAFVGDTLFHRGIGRTDFPYGNGPELIDGIKRKLLPLGDDISFICGHGPGSSFGVERLENPFLLG